MRRTRRHRLLQALGVVASLFFGGITAYAAPTAASAYTEAQLHLLYEEAAAVGAGQYSFYIVASREEDFIREQAMQLQLGKNKQASLRTLLKLTPNQLPAYAIPAAIRDQLRQLLEGERSAAFQMDKEAWAIVELESLTEAPVPGFEQLRGMLPALVAKGALPNPEQLQNDPALVQRRLMNKVTTAKEFDQLPPGFEIDEPLSNGYTLLQQALLRDDPALVSAALKRRADPNLCPMRKCPLQLAAGSKTNALAYLDQLLAAGAKPDLTVKPGDDTALTFASRLGNIPAIERLLTAGADINGGSGNIPPLSIAAYQGHAGAVQTLLAKGADPLYRKEATAASAMNVALNNERPEIIALLRGVARQKLGTQSKYQWSGWLEQDGQRHALEAGIIHLKRQPFSLHVQMPSEAVLHLHSSTGTRIFDEFKRKDLRTPLDKPKNRLAETHDGTARWLLVNDDKTQAAGKKRAGGVQSWVWNNWDKDFNRVDRSTQGEVYVRDIASVILEDGKQGGVEVGLEYTTLPEINIVMGTGVSYDDSTAEFVNPKEFKLVFDR